MWGQGLWEAKHQEGGEEEQGTTEQEAAPPGSDPAWVVRSDVQVAWQQRGHSLVDMWAVGTLMKGPVHRVQGLSNLMEVGGALGWETIRSLSAFQILPLLGTEHVSPSFSCLLRL